MTEQQPVTFINTTLPDIIELKDISQVYTDDDGNETTIIKGFNLLVENKSNQGQFVVILGGSGSGKSTILRYISGLQKPTSGEILIDTKPRTNDNRVGMVFQQYSSFPWLSVLDNVALGLTYNGTPEKERHEKAMAMIQKVGLDGHENKYAQYPTLSGGQLQRVAIARSLVYESRIVLMDEPFGALDVHTRLNMQDLLSQIWNDIQPTIVFVTHDIPEAVYLGDDIYIMGKNPGNIKKHYHVPLPINRTKELKRNYTFINLVHEIEDEMIRIGAL